MYTVQFGQFVLNLEIVLYLAAGLAGAAAIRMRLRTQPEQRGGAASAAVNAVILWIVIWKGSQLLFSPSEVISNPLTLLYFSGGAKGTWLAGAASIAYLLYKLYKQGIERRLRLELAIIAALSWTFVYYLLHIVLIDTGLIYHMLNAGLAAGLLGYMLFRKKPDSWQSLIAAALWFSLGKAAAAFADDARSAVLLSFSIGQLAWLAVSLALLIGQSLLDKPATGRNKEG